MSRSFRAVCVPLLLAAVQAPVPKYSLLGATAAVVGPAPAQVIYYVSQHAVTHAVAMHECRTVYQGRLMTILTVEQDEKVTELLRNAEPEVTTRVWTSGKFQYYMTDRKSVV